ncbi:MAG: chemotaxis protein CheD, partial [Sphingomonas sp.]|nr:chemotaxis protein CheD [Sphingomonas sp.]
MLHQPITPATPPPVLRPVRLTVLQGQARVSGDPRVELTTVLGSCIACCLFDPTSHVGGMNHFLLAEPN